MPSDWRSTSIVTRLQVQHCILRVSGISFLRVQCLAGDNSWQNMRATLQRVRSELNTSCLWHKVLNSLLVRCSIARIDCRDLSYCLFRSAEVEVTCLRGRRIKWFLRPRMCQLPLQLLSSSLRSPHKKVGCNMLTNNARRIFATWLWCRRTLVFCWRASAGALLLARSCWHEYLLVPAKSGFC